MPHFDAIKIIKNDAKFTAAKDVLSSYRRGLEKYDEYNKAKATAADFNADLRGHTKKLRPILIALAAKFDRGEAVHGCTSLAAYAKKFKDRGCLSHSQISRPGYRRRSSDNATSESGVLFMGCLKFTSRRVDGPLAVFVFPLFDGHKPRQAHTIDARVKVK